MLMPEEIKRNEILASFDPNDSDVEYVDAQCRFYRLNQEGKIVYNSNSESESETEDVED